MLARRWPGGTPVGLERFGALAGSAKALELGRSADDAGDQVGKAAPALVCEAMECMGGNGYVEQGGFPLLYREMPVNAIGRDRVMSCAST